MKKFLIYALIIAVIIGESAVALASDISGARWAGTMRISSSSNDTSENVSTIMSLPVTDYLIDNNYADNATDIVIRTDSGGDAKFMPSLNSSFPWTVFVPSISSNTSRDYRFFTGSVSGGHVRYFPPPTSGMTISDAAGMEIINNGIMELTTFIDTTSGDNKTILLKPYSTRISVSENVSGMILADILPSDFPIEIKQFANNSDYDCYAVGYKRAGQRVNNVPVGRIGQISFWLQKFGAPSGTANISIRAVTGDALLGVVISQDVSVLPTSIFKVSFPTVIDIPTQQDIRILFEFNGGDAANYVGLRTQTSNVEPHGVGTRYTTFYTDDATVDAAFTISIIPPIRATATGVSSGEHKIAVTANTTDWGLYIDDVLQDTVALGASTVPDKNNSWIIGSGNTTPYIERYRHYVGGVLQSDIDWEYGTTFTDDSGNGNDAIATLRTTSSDSNITAELIDFAPTNQAQAPSSATVYDGSIIASVPTAPSTMYTDTDSPGVFFAPLVNALLDAGNVPRTLFWYPFGIFTVIGFGILTARLTKQLVTQAAIMLAFMIVFALPGVNIWGMWVPIFFGMEAFTVIVLSKHFSW